MPKDIFNITMAGLTDIGLLRKKNEDCIGFNQDLGVAVLADGMGGHHSGEIAAHMAVELVLEKLENIAGGDKSNSITGSQLLEYISNTISYSNTMIHKTSKALKSRKGMGTTLVATIIKGTQIYAGYAGDSRLYLFRDKELERITTDHNIVQDLVDRGFYTKEKAKLASIDHVVTRALGNRPDIKVDTLQRDIRDGDLLLLCSDGLSNMLADWLIAETLRERKKRLDDTATKLIELANHSGGKDNISVILIQVQKIST